MKKIANQLKQVKDSNQKYKRQIKAIKRKCADASDAGEDDDGKDGGGSDDGDEMEGRNARRGNGHGRR